MKITSLKLINFRNWDKLELNLENRVLIYGPNAQGKTNILEALYLIATTRSFKGRETELISENSDFLRMQAVIEKDNNLDVDILIKKNGASYEKEFKINNKKRSVIDFVGDFAAVIFSPEDINLIASSPDIKRRYLSLTIGQKDREYLYDLLNYKKVLKQRNELLKRWDLGTIKSEIDIWDEKLSEYGQKIINKRKDFVDFINGKIRKYYKDLSGEEKDIRLIYLPSSGEKDLLESLTIAREQDIREKITTKGPHRDNWYFETGDIDVSKIFSRGEARTLILALKLCEKDWLMKNNHERPVILLDDVFSELDEKRRKYLISAFSESQLIITTTDLSHLDSDFLDGTQLLELNN